MISHIYKLFIHARSIISSQQMIHALELVVRIFQKNVKFLTFSKIIHIIRKKTMRYPGKKNMNKAMGIIFISKIK